MKSRRRSTVVGHSRDKRVNLSRVHKPKRARPLPPPPPPPTFPPFQPTRPLENYVRIFFFSARQCGIFPIRFHLSQQQQQSILFCSPQSVFNIIMTHTPAVALVTQSPILLNQWYIYKSKSRFIWSNTGCTMWGPGVVIINPFSACGYRRQLSKPSNMTQTI